MTREAPPVRPEDLSAFLDGELDPARRAAVEKHLLDHPEDAGKLAEYRRRDEALRLALGQPDADAPIPAASLLRAASRKVGGRFQAAVAAVLLMLVLGAGGWWYVGAADQSRTLAALSNEAITAHLLYASQSPGGTAPAENGNRLSARLSVLLGVGVKVPDLSALGFHLVALRELPADSGPAALLVYRSEGGGTLSCYFKRLGENRNSGFGWKAADGVDVFYRLYERLGYAVVGSLPKQTLQRIAEVGYRDSFGQMRD